ncbi:MAG: hypothetical protein NTV93_04015 [Verrucomicrobia bacterium]|nr:hypothetical protein [Verrucomicrobiota bacterium]
MATLSTEAMRAFLRKSITSLNRNKLNGLLAEVDLRQHLAELGFGDRVSRGGWIARREGPGEFGHRTAVFFPEVLLPEVDYPSDRVLPAPDLGLHTICATFHQTGIEAYFCAARVDEKDDAMALHWHAIQLGLPTQQQFCTFPQCVASLFRARNARYNFLRYDADATLVPDIAIADEFSKEHMRVAFQTAYLAEVSDVDGIFWGQQFTYPLEVKEKTAATDSRLGHYFGLDVGPFVKLAYYAAKRGNLQSLFIVREINNTDERALVQWWFITFEQLARFASWVQRAGGTSMSGGASAVVRIPRAEFRPLNAANLREL